MCYPVLLDLFRRGFPWLWGSPNRRAIFLILAELYGLPFAFVDILIIPDEWA